MLETELTFGQMTRSQNYLEGFLAVRRGVPFGVDDLDLLRFRREPEVDGDERDEPDGDRPRRPPRVRLRERDLELEEDECDVERDDPVE